MRKLEARLHRPVEQEFARFVKEREGEVFADMSDYRGKRELISRWMANDFGDRRVSGSIHELSNETMGVVRSGIAFVAARTQDDLFGTAPFFAVAPEGRNDPVLAEKIYQHSEWKLRMARFEEMGEDAIDRVFNLGECVFRLAWKTDVRNYTRLARVLVRGGKPVLTLDGDYVYEGEEMTFGGGERPTSNIQHPTSNGEEASEGAIVVAKDPTIVMTPEMTFADWLIEETETVYEGLDLQPVDYRNWRCSQSYARIEEAPLRGHRYECRLSDIKAKLVAWHGVPETEWDEATRMLFERLRGETTAPKDPVRREGPDGAGAHGDEKNPVIECLDFEIEWDPEGMGDTRWFFGTLLVESEQMLFYDYLCNLLPGGDSLYTVVSAYNPLNKWHGRGWWEIYEDVMRNSDHLWNTLLHRDGMIANPLTGVDWSAIEEDPAEVGFRPGARVTLKTGRTMDQFMQAFAMPNLDRSTWELLQFVLKLNEQEAGASGAAKGDVGGLAATNTATGIQSILSSGSVLHKRPAKQIRAGLQALLFKSLKLLYAMQDKDETFAYGEGENAQLVTLNRADVQGLAMNVRVLMTRFYQREMVQNAQVAAGAHAQYLALPEGEKDAARPLYMQIAKGVGIQNAEAIFRPAIPPDPAAKPAVDPTERLNINYKDMPPEAQQELLEQMGFQVPAEAVEAKAEAEQRPTSNVQRPTSK